VLLTHETDKGCTRSCSAVRVLRASMHRNWRDGGSAGIQLKACDARAVGGHCAGRREMGFRGSFICRAVRALVYSGRGARRGGSERELEASDGANLVVRYGGDVWRPRGALSLPWLSRRHP
jgi:hypothetical protein